MKTTARLTIAFLIVFFVTEPTNVTAADRASDTQSEFHLFLLAGQSNMAGRGKVTPSDRKPHERVLMLSKSGDWVPAVAPMHFDKPIAGVGLGRTFAIEYAKANPNVTVGLIPCAVGGSPISTWEPDVIYKATKTYPYDDAVRRTKLALQAGTLKGILWHQGESDSKPGLAEAYEEKLHALISRMRDEFSAPNVPFVAGQLGQFPSRPWNSSKRIVDAAHRSLADKVPFTSCVSSAGLDHKGDHVHFDAESLREFGRRFFEVYQAVATPDAKKSSRAIEFTASEPKEVESHEGEPEQVSSDGT